MTADDILQEQMAYYRARAAEYDEWFSRVGRYDYGEAINAQWFAEIEEVRTALRRLSPAGHVLELACGTGIWTEELVRIGQDITVVDASAEMIHITQAKLPGANVSYIQADLFDWEPDHQYDLVCFAFWLSHVPPDRLESFLAKVARATRPGGRLFLVDSRESGQSGARTNQTVVHNDLVHERTLKDGRTFRVIKRYYQPDELQAALTRAGFSASIHTTRQFFIYASGTRPQS